MSISKKFYEEISKSDDLRAEVEQAARKALVCLLSLSRRSIGWESARRTTGGKKNTEYPWTGVQTI